MQELEQKIIVRSEQNKMQRLTAAFDYLKGKGLAHKQQDVAQKMKSDAATVSRAFNGKPKALTDNFVVRFNEAYGNLFNARWLLRGEGEMLSTTEDPYGQRHLNSARVLDFICTHENLPREQVCGRAGIEKPGDIEGGLRGFSREELIALDREFPHYELRFLMTGEGEPLRPQTASAADSETVRRLTETVGRQAEQISQLTAAVLNLSSK